MDQPLTEFGQYTRDLTMRVLDLLEPEMKRAIASIKNGKADALDKHAHVLSALMAHIILNSAVIITRHDPALQRKYIVNLLLQLTEYTECGLATPEQDKEVFIQNGDGTWRPAASAPEGLQ